MPLFLSEEEFCLISNDAATVAERADAFIRDIRMQLDVVRAEADAKSIAVEQNCAILEQKYAALSLEFLQLQSENAQLSASNEKQLSELAEAKAEKHQLHIKEIGKDAEIERLSLVVAELQKSKRHFLDLVEQKDAEIRERDDTIQCYINKIVQLTEYNSSKGSKLFEIEADLARCQAACTRVTQEKELLEKQNLWLDEELTTKANTLVKLRRSQMDVEADLTGKIAELERQVKEYSTSLNHSKERVKELELRVKSLEEDLCLSKDVAAGNEEHFISELSTVNKLVELYKASSEEWSKKAGELEGVIKALETHLNQVADDYKEKLEKESSLRKDLEKEADNLRMQLEKCGAELEGTRKANESSLFSLSILPFNTNVEEPMIGEVRSDLSQDSTRMLVPSVAAGVSGTALAASLLRDGWSLTKMYEKYQEAADASRHEKWGRRHAETVLERVLQEIEEKAEMILEERAEHERMVKAYTTMNEKLQQALLEHESYESALRKSKAELRRRERECSIAQKEISDLQNQVTVLLKECQDIQLRCGGTPEVYVNDTLTAIANFEGALLDADEVISQQHLNFKDISELVEQNVKLRSLVHKLAADIEKKEAELKDDFQVDLQRIADDAASKVEVVLKRSEEQASMIDSLHSSVAMYKRLYEEEQKFRSYHAPTTTVSDDGKKELMLLFEGSQDVSKKAYEHLSNRAKILEEELSKLSTELISARAERDKMLLEASFSKERLDSFIKEFDQQRVESNAVSARNIELTHLIIDYQKRLREHSASLQASEENLRKLSLEVSILKHEKEISVSSEKRTSADVQSLTERVHRLQTSLDTIQSAEEIRENARAAERRKQDDYLRLIERDWAEAKKELQEERDRVRSLTLEKEKVTETSMRQVEDIQKELTSAWHTVAAAESRAAVSEARFADLEARFKHTGKQVMTDGGKDDPTVLSTYETSEELWKVKEELEKVKDEARASKDYMLQYKEVARTNEIALKQMEIAHENYKSEALKLKQALEDEVQSLKGQIFELERSYAIKCEEAASANETKEKALSSAMVETSRLRDEIAAKLTLVGEMEIQVTNLKDDLDKEHKRWRIAQDNYERQVILQSETIQELTNTSKELSMMQAEVSRLRELFEAQKAENDLLKSSREKEKTELQHMFHEADRKFSETDEQNKILHNRLEALHVRLAEKEQSSFGKSAVGSEGDGDLQKVINYLRRSKEITETEITLLKQEKLRLQSKLEGAIKASESAQALLRSQLEKSSELLLKDEEFKSLQLQVREINLLRESNVQLREENKHNFEECQKFHDEAQRSKAEAEKLENLLKLKQIEVDALQKDVEVLKNKIGNLNNKNTEMVERYKNININDYEEVKVQLEQYKESINKLEEELSRCREELCEREKKLNDAQKAEAQLIQDIEKQKKHINVKTQIIAKKKEEFSSKIQALSKEVEDLKIKNRALVSENEELSSRNQALTKDKDDLNTKILSLTKEKDELLSKSLTSTKERDELNSKIQALLKQIEDLKSGRKVAGEMPTEQIKKEEEKDKRILMLEKTLEKLREDHRTEKQTRKKTEVAVIDFANRINMDKQKVEDELQKHKVAISVVLEKTGLLVSQLPSSSLLDERTVAYFQSISAFDTAASLFINDSEGFQSSPANASTLDSSATAAVQPAPTQQTKLPRAQLKSTDEKEKAPSVGKASVEARKPGRRFVRPSLEKAEEPITDTEIAGMDTAISSDGNPSSSREHEPSADLAVTTVVRKRLTPSEPEVREGSQPQDEVNVGAPPPSKRSKESELSDISEVHDVPQSLEIGEEQRQEIPTSDISDMPIPQLKAELELDSDKLPLPSHEELIDMAKEDEDDIPVIEESEEQQQEDVDAANKDEAQYEGDVVIEELSDKPSASAESLDEGQKGEDIKEIMYTVTEVEEDREDGELMPDEHEQQPDGATREGPHDTFTGEGAGSGDDMKDPVEIASPNNDQANLDSVDRVVTDIEDAAEDTEKLDRIGGNDQGMHGTALSPEASTAAGSHGGSQITVQQNVSSGQQTPNAPAPSAETSESRVIRSSRTISIAESARRNAQVRQARMAAQQQQQQSQQQQQQQQQPPRHGRAPFRRDGNRGRGRGGRG